MAAGSVDLGPVVLWGLVLVAIGAAVVTAVVRLVWRTGRRQRPP